MRWLILALVILAAPALAEGGDGALVRLLSPEEARPWAAVGRLNVEGAGFCTGTLIAPDRVLTAAHCLYFPRTGRPVPPGRIHFLAGFRKGTFLAHRKVRRYVVHADYRRDEGGRESRLRADLAVLELESPVDAAVAAPFGRADRPRTGTAVALVSYARERSEVPSIQEPCHVLARRGRVLLLSCDVNYGASGAPVFVASGAGRQVAALVSAMTEWEGRPVALSIELGDTLDEVLAALAGSQGVAGLDPPGVPVEGEPATSARKVPRPPGP